jgi:SAM-dependent methyltransferase
MHDTARDIGRLFFERYARSGAVVVEIGALDVNGSLREVCPKDLTYIGIDMEAGPGVNLVVQPSSPLPLQSDIADVVASSSVLEHDTFFWQTFLEMTRLAKPGGVIYINAPSNGKYHRYPDDNWRFYPDAGKALVRWAGRNGYELTLIESFMAERKDDVWNDFVAVFKKGVVPSVDELRFLSASVRCTNVWRFGSDKVHFEMEASEDMVLIQQLRVEIAQLRRDLDVNVNEAARFAAGGSQSLLQRVQTFLLNLRRRK